MFAFCELSFGTPSHGRASIPITHVTYVVKEQVIPTEKISTDIESRKLRKPIVHGRRLKLVSGITKKVIMVRENKGNADVPVTHSEKMAA